MITEEKAVALIDEANPVPDLDSYNVADVGVAAYLATIEQRSSEMIQLDTRPTEKKKPQRGRLILVSGTAAAAILIGGVIALTGGQTQETSSVTAAQPAAVTHEVIQASEVLSRRNINSMEDTIQAEAVLTVDRKAYDSEVPERFDIVLYADARPSDVTLPPDRVTRVIGLPGETIEVRDGSVYVNDRVLEEPYLKNPQILQLPFGPITLGADELWLTGDNRQTSGDSEFRGPIAISLLRGKITDIANP